MKPFYIENDIAKECSKATLLPGIDVNSAALSEEVTAWLKSLGYKKKGIPQVRLVALKRPYPGLEKIIPPSKTLVSSPTTNISKEVYL